MNAKRVKRLRREIEKRYKSCKDAEYEVTTYGNKTVTLKPTCGRAHYRSVKKMYRKFGL